jgi:hypothetical protein
MLTQTTFPVTYSTLDCDALQRQILPLFATDPVIRCKFWNRGLSDVYLVETLTAHFILRISHSHWRTESEVNFELELLDFLRRRGVPVAEPLRTRDGQLSVKIMRRRGSVMPHCSPMRQGVFPLGI